ncbi:MAG TPA: TRAP transporter small permease [Saprospiraceae bacterium]|nr:TRAP transporter small permease [Saprospiraceae bacterium]
MGALRKTVNNVLEKVLIFLMGILVLDVLWQVFSRYLLSSPSSFTDEMAGFLLIWVGLLGAAYVSGRNEHLAIDLLIQKSTPERQRLLHKIISVLIIFFAITVLIIGGSWLAYTRFALDVRSAALDLPLGYVYLVLPFSGFLILFFSVSDLVSGDFGS